MEEKNISRGVIIFPGNMTPSARKVRITVNVLSSNLAEDLSLLSATGYCGNGFNLQIGGVFGIGSTGQYYSSYSCTKTRSFDPRAEKDVAGEVVSVSVARRYASNADFFPLAG